MAVPDTLMPDRIVVGMNPSVGTDIAVDDHSKKMMEDLYRPITRVGKPIVFMSRESAEIVKYASNAFLATKISFINMLSELCEVGGGNVRDVAKGMGLDNRIGPRFLHAGIGYGGSCFPKDVKALLATAKDYGLDFSIIEATDRVNARQRKRFFDRILKALPPASTVAVWGLSFKPKTDDMREAPSLDLLPMLVGAGHTVRVFDPEAMDNARTLVPQESIFCSNPTEAATGAHALIVLTEWDVFRGADLREIATVMKGKDLYDGRNIYEPEEARTAGLMYHGIGL
jgi:UDPglucose 6-dehydrogenase